MWPLLMKRGHAAAGHAGAKNVIPTDGADLSQWR